MVCIPGLPCGQGGGEKGRRRPGQGSGGGCHLITALRQRNLALVGHQAQKTQATLDGPFIPGRDGDCPPMEITWRQLSILHPRSACVGVQTGPGTQCQSPAIVRRSGAGAPARCMFSHFGWSGLRSPRVAGAT
jgi:hypothetical protein